MRYCPNIPCPHRNLTRAPAEFLDHVTHCSDCGTRLVASEEDAIEGLRADAPDPYRAAGAVLRDPASPRGSVPAGRAGEMGRAVLLVLGGAAIALLAYAATGQRSALYLVLLGPIFQRARAGARRAAG